ncbi:MAG TPA: tetratricopeptide repeat protein, partial [Thermoanaerobaculia bacterium]|nr:tetratricopeptide repeat protein [Thermoanaerobaculia bacterium]
VLDGSRAPVTGESLLGNLADRLHVSQATDGLAERVRSCLLFPRSFLRIENVDAEPLARAAAELIVQLTGCPILVTGRYQSLGESLGWIQVPVRPFDEPTALAQLNEELGEEMREEPASYKRLAHALGFLPLAVHLAAGYLKAGHSVDGFLTRLRQTGFTLPVANVAEPVLTRDQSRTVIASTFALSRDLLKAQLGAERERLTPGFLDLGHAPPAGFGASLGAAIAGLPALDYEQLTVAAQRLSLLDPIPPTERKDRAYRLHPLLAELLRAESGEEGAERAHARMTDWFCARLPELPAGQEEEQRKLWHEIQIETGALTRWLAEIREKREGVRVESTSSWFAILNGPFHAWQSFCEKLLQRPLKARERSDVLWTLSQVALRSGDLDRAAAAARDKAKLDRSRGAERKAALATGTLADVLQARGQLDEALRIRREEELPVYERLGEARERAVTMGKIADVLHVRGELDEELRIRREEELPVYERLGDALSRAMTMGKIAALFHVRGELDEELRIRREEQLPLYERLGLGASRDMVAGRFNLAKTYLKRKHPGDRETAIELLKLALEAAERLRIPEVEEKVRSTLQETLDTPSQEKPPE